MQDDSHPGAPHPDAPQSGAPEAAREEAPLPPEALCHPRGTLAIVLIYGTLFGLGWLALYFFEFVPRGAPHP
jgi:hypothetical protein